MNKLMNEGSTKKQKILSAIVFLFIVLFITVTLLQKSQQSRQFAQATGGNFCSSLMIASSSQFKSQKSTACNPSFKSFAISQIKTSSGCTSDAEAGAALDGACSLPADQIPATGCTGNVIASVPEFINNKEAACGASRTVWVNGLATVTNGERVCASQADAENAMAQACGNVVPSPACIGSCLTPSTAMNAATATPANAGVTVQPTASTGASIQPTAAAGGGAAGGGAAGGGANGFMGILQAILQMIMPFIMPFIQPFIQMIQPILQFIIPIVQLVLPIIQPIIQPIMQFIQPFLPFIQMILGLLGIKI